MPREERCTAKRTLLKELQRKKDVLMRPVRSRRGVCCVGRALRRMPSAKGYRGPHGFLLESNNQRNRYLSALGSIDKKQNQTYKKEKKINQHVVLGADDKAQWWLRKREVLILLTLR